MIQVSLVESNNGPGFTISTSAIDCDDKAKVQQFLDKTYKLGPKEQWIIQSIEVHKTFEDFEKYLKEII